MDLAVGTVVANTYEILGPLGRGGMGELFRARNIRTERPIALKLLRPDNKHRADAIERFRREARAAGMINSDHVTQVLDVEDDPKLGIAIAFELLEGDSLLERLRKGGAMDVDTVHPIVEQILRGLADAHRVDIIHRDLKPSNVFLEKRPDGTQRVKILDFGISKLPKQIAKTTLTEPGQSLGSFMFMPPEQIQRAAAVDARADIYAVGTLVFQAMTGHLPYSARNMVELVTQKTSGQARTMAAASGKAFVPALEQWVAKCLALQPGDRFQTAQDAAAAWAQLKPASDLAQSSDRRRPSQPSQPLPVGYQPLPQGRPSPQHPPSQGGPVSQRGAPQVGPSTPSYGQQGTPYAANPGTQPGMRGGTLQLSPTSPEVMAARQALVQQQQAQFQQQQSAAYGPPPQAAYGAPPHPLSASGQQAIPQGGHPITASGQHPMSVSGPHPLAQSGPRSAQNPPAAPPPSPAQLAPAPSRSVPAWLIVVAVFMVVAALGVTAAVVLTLVAKK